MHPIRLFSDQPSTRRSTILLLGLLILASAAHSQSADGLTPFDVARIRSVGSAALAPDGVHVVYTVRVPADPLQQNESARSEVRLLNLTSGEDRVLLSAEVGASAIAWTPDGEHVSFRAKMEGDEFTSLYSVGLDSSEVRRVASFDRSIGAYDFSDDGKLVAFIASGAKAPDASTLPVSPEVYEESETEDKVWIARAYDVEAAVRMLRHNGSASGVHWSPDGSRILVAVAPTPLTDDFYMNRRLAVLDAASGNVVSRIENPGKLGDFEWSPDGMMVALVSGADINDPKEGRLMVASASGGAAKDILPDLAGHVHAFEWTASGALRYLAGVGVGSRYAQVNRDGSNARTLLESRDFSLNSFDPGREDQATVFVVDSPSHPSELFIREAPGREVRRLTNSNPWLDSVPLAEQEVVTYSARDGLEIEGLLIRPLGEKAGERYPLVAVVHGGPESHYSNGWLTSYSSPGHIAAAKGMAVFYPNYRGSTGRGVAFSKTSQADPAGKEFDDVVDGVDYLIGTGLVNPDRVGVTGGSYGGYATAWMSTYYSDRFAAGVMFVGISNKVSKVGTTDIPNEEYLVHARKRPWDDWQFFLERSPVYYADRGETPLLIMHGAEDPRVNPGQSRELYRHLKLRGSAPVRLVFYPGEGHGNRKSAARLDYSLRSMRWLEHYLTGPGGDPPPYPVDVTSRVEVVEPTY